MPVTTPQVFIGYDPREDAAYRVAEFSIRSRTSAPVEISPIVQQDVRDRGLYWRERDVRASTEFSLTRFLTPHLAGHQGWAVFADCDFLFLCDIHDLFAQADLSKAVQVVQHDYTPSAGMKMDGCVQHIYPRKNWSSMILWNCEHPANQRLTLDVINTAEPSFLHRFGWLDDSEIGALDCTWNFLEGVYQRLLREEPKVIHYTHGGPWFDDWQHVDYAAEWLAEQAAMRAL